MKSIITSIIIGLFLLLPMALSADTTSTQAGIPDLSQVCSESRISVKEGDSFTYCGFDIQIGAVDEDNIKVNTKSIAFDDSYKFDGIKVTYEGFEGSTAEILLSAELEKKMKNLEKGKFMLFYETAAGTPAFLGTVDATTERIAEINYGTNNAYLRIRSSTPEKLILGLDFENADRTVQENLHLMWGMHHTLIEGLEDYTFIGADQSSELAEFEVTTEGAVNLDLDGRDYTINLDKETLDNKDTAEVESAIKVSSGEKLTVYQGSNFKQTKAIWISTMLAEPNADTSCIYDLDDGSLDNFAKRSSVRGYYPAFPKFFDTFTDYCKDEFTLVKYGCVGMKGANWKDTSRVAFLEISCNCQDGTCAAGPYCIDSDKHADDLSTSLDESISVKGKLKILEPGQPVSPSQNYDNGMKLFLEKAFNPALDDACEGEKLREYFCDPSKPGGYDSKLVDCPNGEICEGGRCKTAGAAQECTKDEDCTADKPKCSAEGKCVQCTIALDCKEGCPIGRPLCHKCSAEGKCETAAPECTKDEDCTGVKSKCSTTGTCVRCITDADCTVDKPKCSTTGTCETAASTTTPEDLSQARAELEKLEGMITQLQSISSGQKLIVPPGGAPGVVGVVDPGIMGSIFDKFKGILGITPKLEVPGTQLPGEVGALPGLGAEPIFTGPQPVPVTPPITSNKGFFGNIGSSVGNMLGLGPDSATELFQKGGSVTESVKEFGAAETAGALIGTGIPTQEVANSLVSAGVSAESTKIALVSAGVSSSIATQAINPQATGITAGVGSKIQGITKPGASGAGITQVPGLP